MGRETHRRPHPDHSWAPARLDTIGTVTGRGEIGQPKLFADIPEPRLIGGAYHCEASWMGFKFLEVRVAEIPQPEPAPVPQLQGTLMLKYVPRTGVWGEADICQVSFTPAATPNQRRQACCNAAGSENPSR